MAQSDPQEPAPGPQPAAKQDFWDGRRRELFDSIAKKAPRLAAIYRASVTMYHDAVFPARQHFVAHAVRELGNRLPDVLGVAKEARFEATPRLDSCGKIWRDAGILDAFPEPVVGAAPAPDGLTQLPRAAAEATRALLSDHVKSRESRKDAAVRLFRAIAPERGKSLDELRPVALQWYEVLDWFVSVVHVPVQERHISEEEFNAKFDLFEKCLASILLPFFAGLKEVDDILDKANR
jgi:hypothetical protein